MDKKRWILTAVLVTVVVTVLEALFHGFVLRGQYASTALLWRSQADMGRLMPFGWATTLIYAFFLIYIYHRGYEGKGSRISEGLRFGLVIGLFTSIPMAVWTYIMMPIPPAIPAGWFLIGMIDTLVAGAIIGMLYRPTKA